MYSQLGDYEGLGAKGKRKKLIKKIARIAIPLAVVAGGAYFVGPALLTKLNTFVGTGRSLRLGNLKWLGGKLVSAPSKTFKYMQQHGIDPATASASQVAGIAAQVGDLTPQQAGQFLRQTQQPSYIPEGTPGIPIPEGGEISQAGVTGGMTGYIPWIIGAGVLILMATGVAKPVKMQIGRRR